MTTSRPDDTDGAPEKTETSSGMPATINRDPRVEFTSAVPWSNTPPDCVVIACSDPRFEQQNEEFVRALGFKQPHFMQIPSGVAVFTSLVAAAGFLHKGMGLLLSKAIDLTGVKHVICLGHEDCGAYKAGKVDIVQTLTKRLADKPVRDLQHDHLAKAGKTVSRQLGRDVEVGVYYADVVQAPNAPERVKFLPVGRWSGGRPVED